LHQRDAISLTRPGRHIDIAIQQPHDGYLFGDSIYFTTVDGHLVIVNQKTLQIERAFDLKKMGGAAEQTLGWCRGLLPLDHRHVWGGFTRVRSTKFRENLAWIKSGATQHHRPSHVALYDLESCSCLEEIELEPHGIGVVFSLFHAFRASTPA